jgi:hypothetical protein
LFGFFDVSLRMRLNRLVGSLGFFSGMTFHAKVKIRPGKRKGVGKVQELAGNNTRQTSLESPITTTPQLLFGRSPTTKAWQTYRRRRNK